MKRNRLGLPQDQLIIAFGAESLENRRKGFLQLMMALPLIRKALPVTAVCFGNPAHLPPCDETLPDIINLGFVENPNRLAEVYSAADLFVLPSLEEALGQTGVESLACGTPVVAFDTGGIRDYVIPQHTGLLAPVGDIHGLARQVVWLLERPAERRRLGREARQLVVAEFDMQTQASKHGELYQSLVEQRINSSFSSLAKS